MKKNIIIFILSFIITFFILHYIIMERFQKDIETYSTSPSGEIRPLVFKILDVKLIKHIARPDEEPEEEIIITGYIGYERPIIIKIRPEVIKKLCQTKNQ